MFRAGVLCLIALMCASGVAAAQTGTIVGTVTAAESGLPLSDVQVRVQGTGLGALTRENGRFAIATPPGTYTVRVLRLGYAADSLPGVVVRDGQSTTADITMRTAAAVLKSVLSVGYGTQEARDRTGVVDQVTSEEFNSGRVIAPAELIQAKVAGVQVADNAEPGGATSIRIRGGTSTTSSNEPLFVIDGIPIAIGGGFTSGRERNPLDFINPNDIESITVLKDASATAIYGSRGANGVIMISTKTGSTQGARVTYNGSVSGSKVTGEPDLLDAAQYRAAVTAKEPGQLALLGTANTDWQDAVQRSAGGAEHSLAVAGAGEDMNYRLSLGLLDQKGVIQGTELKRISAALNYNDELFDNRISMRSTIQGSRTEDFYTPGPVISAATAMAPTQPLRTATGQYFEWASTLGVNNPLGELALVSDRGTTYRSIGKLEGEYRLPFRERISVTSRVGYDVAKAERTTFSPSVLRSETESGNLGTFSRTSPSQINTLFDLFGTWRRDMPRFTGNFDVTAGYSFEETHSEFPFFQARGLSSDLLGPYGVPASTTRITTFSIDESRLISFFGRTNVSLRDKYLMTLSVRKDGSSKFGPSQQWGTFPSAAFAWRLSDESFMKRFEPVSDLKLRFSWGINGNQAFNNYQQFSSYTIGANSATAQFGNTFVSTIRPSGADPGIKWEQTRSQNLGADWGLFKNRLSGAVDYYYKLTKDLIFFVQVPAGTNLSNAVTTNIGTLENEGLEFSVNAAILTGVRNGFTWNAMFNAATNRNQLMQINSVSTGKERIPAPGGGISGGVGSNIQVLAPGYPINSFYVYRHKRGPGGKPVYADTDNDGTVEDIEMYDDLNNDNIINDDDKRIFHSPAPKWILGHTSTMGFRNFDAGFTIRAYRGNYIYNNVASSLGHYSAVRGSAPVNLHSSVLRNNFTNPQYFSDVYIEDASFIRMDNLSLGYTFRQVRSVSALRVFGVVQNVFTITDYTGVDPMAGINGVDNNIYPRSRTMTAGVNVAF